MTPDDLPPLREALDRMIRQSLEHPDNLRALLQEVVPDLAAGFDCTRARLLKREFPLDDWRHREADLPFEVPYRVGDKEQTALVCVLVEHQSDTDPLMPLRLLYVAVVYWERQWQAWERLPRPRPPLRLAPVLPVVLYTGAVPWGSNRTLADLLGEPTAFHAFAPRWEPLFWNLAERTPEALLGSGEGWLQVLAVLRAVGADATGFHDVFVESLRRLEALAGRDHVRWYDLLRMVLTLAMRRPKPERAPLRQAAEASQTEATHRQEVMYMGQSIAEVVFEEGVAKGKAEGAVETARALLQKLLERNFGPLPQALADRIVVANDLQKLQAAFDQAIKLTNLDDLQL